MRVDLVTVPYRYDERGEGLGAGPDALLAAGLPEQLRAAGIDVTGPNEAHLEPALKQAAGAGAAIGVVWVDAHGDFNTPETSFSGILAGMPVAIMAGLAGPLWRNAAGLATPVATDNIILAGVRELDEKEEELIRYTDVQVIPATELCDGHTFAQAIDQLTRRCALLYL